MELGTLDPPTHVHYNRLGASDLRTEAHLELSYQVCGFEKLLGGMK